MRFSMLDTRLARWGFYLALIGITVLALIPAHDVPASTGWDKADHWLAFFTLSLLGAHAYPQQPFWRRLAIVLVLYGIGIELAQWCTPDRDADWHDVVADSIGIAAYGFFSACCDWIARPRPASE
jgi:VanZ family protein